MDFRQLSYFICIAEEGSFTKASQKLHISQPALSKMMRNFENDIGAQLMLRTGHKLQLTDIGEAIFDEGQRIVSDYKNLTDYVKNISESTFGKIIVGTPPVIGTCLFPSFLPGFYKTYPNVEVTFLEEGAYKIQDQVLQEKVDLGVVILPVNQDKFDIVPIVEDFNVLVVHKTHKLAKKKFIKISELVDEKFLLLNENYSMYYNIITACENSGYTPNITLKCSNWDFLIEMVLLEQGITILPRPIVEKYVSQDICKIPIEDELLKWKIVVIFKKNRLVPSVAKKFVGYMKEYGKV